MAQPFQPRFVDLVRNYTTTSGTGSFSLGAAVRGFAGFADALQPGDQFYYSAAGLRSGETEVGRGTLRADGTIVREPIDGPPTDFSAGTKTVSLVAAAEWFDTTDAAIAGKIQPIDDRAALAETAVSASVVYLRERGREGMFGWNAADVSALVAADPLQGLYVAPTSDPTGASGAWSRQYRGNLHASWFGLVADDDLRTGTDGSAAINAALLLANRLGPQMSYAVGGPSVELPPGKVFCAASIQMRQGVGLVGAGLSPNERTKLRFGAGIHGIAIMAGDAQGGGNNAQGTVIRGIALTGGWAPEAPNEGEFHGIYAETAFDVRNIYIEGFQGDGIHITSSSDVSNGYTQQGNCFVIRDFFIKECRDCIFIQGSDANVGSILKGSALYARRWGIFDDSFLGNSISTVHTDGCGSTTAYAGIPACGCSYNGNHYSVVKGQEAAASTNPPSGTTADNAWWYYVEANAVPNPAWPAWVSGTKFRAGGPFYIGSASLATACYVEQGQPVSQLGAAAIAIGSQAGASFKGTGIALRSYLGWLRFGSGSRGAIVDGDVQINGPNKGGPDLTVNGQVLNFSEPNGVYSTTLNFQAAGVTKGYFGCTAGGTVNINGNDSGYLKANGNSVVNWWAAGLTICAGYRLDMGSTTVIDSSRNGTFATVNTGATGAYKINGTTIVDSARNATLASVTATGTVRGSNLSGTNTGDQVITLSGDVTGTGTGSFAATISGRAVTFAKLQAASGPGIILGRASAGSGSVEELTLGPQLALTGATLGLAANLTLGNLTITGAAAVQSLTSTSGGIGYAAGAGGAAIQATSKATGVTIDKPSGQITMNAAALAASTSVSFVLSNALIAANDILVLSHASGGTAGAYALTGQCAAGSATVTVRNLTAGSLSQSIVVGFALIKAAVS